MSIGNREAVHLEITKISEREDCSFFDAASIFCEENDIDVEEFMKCIDMLTLTKIKLSAIESNKIRRKNHKKETKKKIDL